ncbi:hypothetical protein BX616_001168 [Lobosporangium transversale]|uniref:DUS-like FMN-binding domain-containing protein n=1 Tax=Lobosporangium transversale TaxID=64571 RepID=A0A1Y2H2J9_9FUNG|nr:hypothetical protein BCR41DRAFT_330809 [Lobosporangium transversale]KAF9904819.1 hypothetical protein BX616_001168 [Lobosporangium transversale]ORZ28244.1 hypothetical protein BCR41DRAFT_330809 [Lobosporangium transversale]|eukprot:XP_021885929.1 hypothetical protein BCR41DRAFT_330809 [Lobosporangium transversale]
MQALDYTNARILAPMVRIGTLPTRLMALEYGADLVYTPEVVDKAIAGAVRVVNEDNGTIDYLQKGVSVFRTHPSEKSKLVFQIGSANADLALEAALTVAQDVSTVDLNCGCPKRFSVHGGMGAALMEEPEKLCGILRKLVEHSGLPVTCKIRIFPDRERTIKLVKMIEATGIKALAVHCRYRDQRPRERAHWDRLKEIVEAVSIPVIANGDAWEYEHLGKLQDLSGATAVMYARRAEANVSVFRKEGLLPLNEIVTAYIRKCLETRNHHSNTKYVLMQMFVDDTKDPRYRQLCEAKCFRAVCKVFGMEGELDAWLQSQQAKGYPTDLDSVPRKAGEMANKDEATNAANTAQKHKQQDLRKRKLEQQEVEGEEKNEISAPATKKQMTEISSQQTINGDHRSSSRIAPTETSRIEEIIAEEKEVDNNLPSAGAEQGQTKEVTSLLYS